MVAKKMFPLTKSLRDWTIYHIIWTRSIVIHRLLPKKWSHQSTMVSPLLNLIIWLPRLPHKCRSSIRIMLFWRHVSPCQISTRKPKNAFLKLLPISIIVQTQVGFRIDRFSNQIGSRALVDINLKAVESKRKMDTIDWWIHLQDHYGQ